MAIANLTRNKRDASASLRVHESANNEGPSLYIVLASASLCQSPLLFAHHFSLSPLLHTFVNRYSFIYSALYHCHCSVLILTTSFYFLLPLPRTFQNVRLEA